MKVSLGPHPACACNKKTGKVLTHPDTGEPLPAYPDLRSIYVEEDGERLSIGYCTAKDNFPVVFKYKMPEAARPIIQEQLTALLGFTIKGFSWPREVTNAYPVAPEPIPVYIVNSDDDYEEYEEEE